MKAKTKFLLLKIFGIFLDVIAVFGFTSVCVLLNLDRLWSGIDKEGFTSFTQWFSLILYRILLYLTPAMTLSFFKFDKRFKFSSRFRIWLNWTLGLYLLTKAVISVFSIDKVLNFSIFNNLDSIVLLIGYVFTFFTKEKISFDSTGAILDPKKKD